MKTHPASSIFACVWILTDVFEVASFFFHKRTKMVVSQYVIQLVSKKRYVGDTSIEYGLYSTETLSKSIRKGTTDAAHLVHIIHVSNT